MDDLSPCTQTPGNSLQSSGIQPSLTMLLIRSVIHLVPKPPDAFIISLTTPVGSAAFHMFNTLPLHHPSHSQHLEAFHILPPYILHTISIKHNISDIIFHTAHANDISSLSCHLSSNPEAVLPSIFTLKINSEFLDSWVASTAVYMLFLETSKVCLSSADVDFRHTAMY